MTLARVRREVRKAYPDVVDIVVGDREGLRTLWLQDISKGGVFVETATPLGLGTKVEVRLETPHGLVSLNAEVVHVLDGQTAGAMGAKAGMGLQFLNLDAAKKQAIGAYVEGVAARLSVDATQDLNADWSQTELDTLKQFFVGVENDALYQALNIAEDASAEAIKARGATLDTLFSRSLGKSATPALLARAQRAVVLLRRIVGLMTDPARRLDYDFRCGHIRADERIEKAREVGDDVVALRNAWIAMRPEHFAQAEQHALHAARREDVCDYAGALEAGRKALDCDPFNLELRSALARWERLLGGSK